MYLRLLVLFGVAGLALAAPVRAQFVEGQGSWSLKSPMPAGPRAEMPAAVVNDRIYVFGGSAKEVGYDMDRTEEYDPATDPWRRRAAMPRGLNHIGAVALDDKIYSAGG